MRNRSKKVTFRQMDLDIEPGKSERLHTEYEATNEKHMMGFRPPGFIDQTARDDRTSRPINNTLQVNRDLLTKEEPHVILRNFKHLLHACRWQKESSINYLEWMVTIANDCFFYFLRKSEPFYAFHCLALAEYYM